MINIIKFKLKDKYKNINKNYYKSPSTKSKEFLPNIRQWKNSIYTYNKNTLSLIPEASKLTIKLIKGYFDLYKLNTKILKKKIKRWDLQGRKKAKILEKKNRYNSTSKIFVNKGQFKHTNDLVNITIYFYNRQMSNYLSKIKKKFLNNKKYLYILKKKIYKIKLTGKKYQIIQKKIRKNLIFYLFKRKKTLLSIKNLLSFKAYQNIYFKRLIKKSLKIVVLYLYFLQLIYFNKSKFNNYYLQGLINLIKKIYRKNVVFNFINIKYFYLNSEIFTESFIFKLKKDRRKLSKYMKSFIKQVNIKKVKLYKSDNIFKLKSIFNINYLNLFNNNLDITNILLYNLMLQNKTKTKSLKKTIFNNIKYKNITGVTLKASGRLTKRFTASRSLTKIKHKGSLVNINSSIYGDSTAFLKGKQKSNIEYTKLNSKTRIGSFGIKGWISGY